MHHPPSLVELRRGKSPRVHSGHRASRHSCSLFSQQGACGTRWQKAASATRPGASRAARLPLKVTAHERWPSPTSEVVKAEPGPRKQPFACVPHADGFVGLLDVPDLGGAVSAPRSCELSPGHSLEPSARFAVVFHVRLLGSGTLKDIRGRQSLRTSAPRSTPRDHRCALRIGTGREQNIPARARVQKRMRGCEGV